MIEEQYISFEIAKLAKEKGFNESISTLYKNGIFKHHKPRHSNNPFISNKGMTDNCYSAPTQSLLARWLRDNYNIHVVPRPMYESELGLQEYGCDVHFPNDRGLVFCNKSKITNVHKDWGGSIYTLELGSYEEAMEEGLKEALKSI